MTLSYTSPSRICCVRAVPESRFLGDMVLNLWDCGGQDAFYETYFSVQRGLIFRNVEVRPRKEVARANRGCIWRMNVELVLPEWFSWDGMGVLHRG